MTLRRKARLLEQRDKSRQIPERHRLRGGKALPDFAGRQRGWQTKFGERLRRLVWHRADAVLDQPIALFELCCSSVDARGEAHQIVEEQQRDCIEDQLPWGELHAVNDDLVAGL